VSPSTSSEASSIRLRSWVSVLLGPIVLVALVVFVHRQSPRTLVGDALGQAAIAQRTMTGVGGGAPPESPFFAGEPLPDAWLTPWIGGSLARLFGLDALHGLELVALLAAAVFALALCALGRRLYRAPSAGLVVLWLALAGAFAHGPLLLAVRLRSWGPPQDDGTYLHGVVHPITRYMRVWDGWAEAGPLVSEWLGSTGRPFGLAAIAVLLFALHAFLERGSVKRGLVLALSAALGAGAAPMLVAPAAVALGAVQVIVAFAIASDERSNAPGRALAAAAWLVAGLAAGLAFAWPAFGHLGEAFAVHPLHEARAQVARMAESAWLLAALATLGTLRVRGAARRFGIVTLGAVGVLSAGCAFALLPERAENDLFRAALVLLAVPAAGWAVYCAGDLRRELAAGVAPWRALLVCAVFSAPFAVVVRAHLGRAPVPVAFERGRLVRTPASATESRLYAWIVSETAPDAVLVVDPTAPLRVVSGSTRELPAFTRRTLFTERLEHPLVAGEADAQLRHWIALDAVAGRPLGVEGDAYLGSLERDVFVVTRGADDATRERLATLHGAAAFRAEDVAVFRWRAP